MNFRHIFRRLRWAVVFLAIGPTTSVAQEILFEDDFESAQGLTTGNAWSWQSPFSPSSSFGMMFGEGDIYSIQSFGRANSGQRVLRLNFDGRNGFCNTCGNTTHYLTASEISSSCIGINGAPWGGSIFNKDNGFSRWEVTSETSSSVCFRTSAPTGGSLFGNSQMEIGDELKVPKRCGSNGTVGTSPSRRSDCNLAINYLNGITGSEIQPGETLARRLYFFIPSGTILPDNGIKLGYTEFRRSAGNTANVIPVISVQRNSQVFVEGGQIFGYTETEVLVQRETWYYLEEIFTRETSPGASDGTYTLYVGRADDPNVNQPAATRTGLEIGEINRLSIIGNWQHNNDAIGSMYLDDIVIAKGRIGPTNSQVRPQPLGWQ